MNRLDMVPDACPLKPRLQSVPGRCAVASCNAVLPSRRRRWCSDTCADLPLFWRNHFFPIARTAALSRDGHRCVRCGAVGRPPKDEQAAIIPPPAFEYYKTPHYWKRDDWRAWRTAQDAYNAAVDALNRRYQLEVNHRIPAEGAHADVSCLHHLDNLETLCAPCHKRTTAAQARERAARRNKRILLLECA